MGYEELAHLGMVEFHEASMRMGEERGRQEGEERGRQEGEERGRQEGEQKGEERTLLAIASRLVSPAEAERLSTLTLEQLRVEVEARIAALAGQQR
jgi:flagellar biosynthesis/type III secretory pathway protein FliH